MRLIVLGRSPARPNPNEACAGYLLEAGGSRLLLDAGPGVVAQLLRLRHPDDLDAVVISHMHTDHFLDLVTLRYVYPWAAEARRKLRVILPPGSMQQMGEMARGAGYPDFWEKAFALEEHDGEHPFAVGDVRLEPGPTQHYIPTWGFRITARGTGEDSSRLFVYSADSAPCEQLDRLIDGAHLLLCEATLRTLQEDAAPPEPRGHLLPAEAGEIARRAGVERLLLTHLPTGPAGAPEASEQASRTFERDVAIAEPQRTYEV
jgi:ribonuclease BN (tRNA processing enzyme)